MLDQYFPGDVDPDIPPNDDSGEEQQDTGNGDTGNGETIDAGAAEGEVTGDGADLDGLD